MPKMIKTVAAGCAAALLLSSCSGIGDGASPESLKILQVTPETVFDADFILGEQIPGKAYTCVRGVLQAFIFFDDGDVGNFTRRVKWTSSDPSILTVSNFDEPVPGTPENRFDFGSIAPLSPGSVTVTATYLNMTATIPVTVEESGDITIAPGDLSMAPRSFQALRTTATLGGRLVDLTGQTVFDLNNGDPEAVEDFVTLTPTGTISALNASEPVTIKGKLNVQGGACATRPGTEASVNLQVRTIPTPPTPNPVKLGLNLEPEDGFTTTIAEGTSQFLKLIARFGDFNADGDADDPNEFQDLSFQPGAVGTYTSSDLAVASFIGSSLLGRGTLVYGVPDVEAAGAVRADGTSNLSAVYAASPQLTPPDPGVSSNTLVLTVRDVPLRSIAITSSAERDTSQSICTVTDTFGQVPATVTGGKFICLKATGTFGPDASGADYVQDITKDVDWTTTVPTVMGVASGRILGAGVASTAARSPTSGGTAGCEGATTCTETITATFTTNEVDAVTNVPRTVTATATVDVAFPTTSE